LEPRSAPLQPVDKALLLRQHPLLARATATQLLALVSAAREVPLLAGSVLFADDEPAALYQVLTGSVRLESNGADPIAVAGGFALGVAETLAGSPFGWRATVTQDGRALRVDREELFVVLTDHLDLMQGLFSGVLSFRDASRTPQPV
jgi:CRP-like cAMP-binding protein